MGLENKFTDYSTIFSSLYKGQSRFNQYYSERILTTPPKRDVSPSKTSRRAIVA